jgi:hypothetical protein
MRLAPKQGQEGVSTWISWDTHGILMGFNRIHIYIYIRIYIYNYIYNRIAIPSSNIDTAVDGGWKTTFLFG